MMLLLGFKKPRNDQEDMHKFFQNRFWRDSGGFHSGFVSVMG
jgi:hypothetical protein